MTLKENPVRVLNVDGVKNKKVELYSTHATHDYP